MSAQPQHAQAFARGQELRFERLAVKRAVKERRSLPAGCAAVAALLDDPPQCLATLEVRDLLGWIHRAGVRRAERWVRRAGIVGARQVKELTARQRQALAADLRGESAGEAA